MNKYNDCKFIYWKLDLINIQRITFDTNKWNNIIINKIKDYTILYENEKKKSKNLFIEDSD
jgi:hypothetical protein